MKKVAIAIRHVHFETLGTFEQELVEAGYSLRYFDAACQDLSLIDPCVPDLLIVLGGPIGVRDTNVYQFLADELSLIKARLDACLPLLGICLGAQLIAAALGAKVIPMGVKEIGFAPLTLTRAGARSPLRHLADVPVLHWHGDSFEIPRDAELLATTMVCNQAFSIDRCVLALQFHPEADTDHNLEPWLIGHAVELGNAAIDPRRIRADACKYGRLLRNAGRLMFAEWLNEGAAPDGVV